MKKQPIIKALLGVTIIINSGLSASGQSGPASKRAESAVEKNYIKQYRDFIKKGKEGSADSIVQIVKTKFPSSVAMRSELIERINGEKNQEKKELLFQQCVEAFPTKNFKGIFVIYDYYRAGFGAQQAKDGNIEKAVAYGNALENAFWKGEGVSSISRALIQKGDTSAAEGLLLQGINITRQFLNPKPNDNEAQFSAIGFPYLTSMYGELMYRKKNYDTAVTYLAESERYAASPDANFYLLYANVLKSMNRLEECRQKLETAVINGATNPGIYTLIKEVYATNNPGSKGEDEYLADLNTRFLEALKKKVAKEILDLPALPFTLKDLNGNKVSLADMKGKVVVLDFWATWCGPCKASFPAMKKAQERYKNAADVQFLFIDCWEKTDNYETTVKNFIQKNSYDFNVLFDPKSEKGKSVAETYGVTAIPAKFVIDGNGRIKFKLAGFTGGEQAAIEELSVMIEMSKTNKPT